MIKKLTPILIFFSFILTLSLCSCVDFSAAASEVTPEESASVVYVDSEADFLEMLNYGGIYGGTYILRTDIYLDRYYAENDVLKFSYFSGTLDGRGHAIVGFRATPSVVRYTSAGEAPGASGSGEGSGGEPLFENAFVSSFLGWNQGTIKNLKLVDLELKASSDDVKDEDLVFAPIGINDGTIQNVEVLFSVNTPESTTATYYPLTYLNRRSELECVSVSELPDSEKITAGEGEPTAGEDANFFYEIKSNASSGAPPQAVDDLFSAAYALYSRDQAVKKLAGDVNLYNSTFFEGKEDALNELADGTKFGYFNAGSYTLTGIPVNDGSQVLSSGTAPTKGDGSEKAPFEISSVEKLVYLNGNSEAGKYYMLTANISLAEYKEIDSGSLLGDFHGVLDGNGNAVTGIKGAFISSSGEDSVIRNITLDFSCPNTEALQNVKGRLEKITATGTAPVFADFDGGSGSGISVMKTGEQGYIASFSGTITELTGVRSYAGKFYRTDDSGSQKMLNGITNCYQDNAEWGATIDTNAKVSDSFKADADDVNRLIVSTESNAINSLSSAGWAFGSGCGFAMKKGSDSIELVFPEDRAEYKSVPVFRKGSAVVVPYASSIRQFSGNETTLQDDFYITDLNKYIADNYLGVEEPDAEYTWTNSSGNIGENDLVQASDYSGDDMLHLKYYSEYHLFNLSLARINTSWVMYGTIIEFAYNGNKFFVDYSDKIQFLTDYLTEDSAGAFGYKELKLTVSSGDEVFIDTSDPNKAAGIISKPGVYTLTISAEGTASTTPTKAQYTFEIIEGTIPGSALSGCLLEERAGEITSGGFSEDTAYEFDPGFEDLEIVLSEDFPLNVNGFRLEIAYKIIRYKDRFGTETGNISGMKIGAAGTYTLILTLRATNFNDFVSGEVSYTVLPAQKTITADDLIGMEYGSSLPEELYGRGSGQGDLQNYPLEITETDYSQFCTPGDYFLRYVVSGYSENDYVFRYSDGKGGLHDEYGTLYFEVSSKKVTFKELKDEGVFTGYETVYNQKEHSLAFNPDNFPYVAGDPHIVNYDFKTLYAEVKDSGIGNSREEPFGYIYAGEYNVNLISLALRENYEWSNNYFIDTTEDNFINAKLTINKRGLTLTADDRQQDYGSLPIASSDYEFTLSATDPDYPIADYIEEIENEISLDKHNYYSIECDYKQFDLPGKFDIIVTKKSDLRNFKLEVEKGSLTINKIDLSDTKNFDIEPEYVYDFKTVDIEFTGLYNPDNIGEEFKSEGKFFAAGYPKYYNNGSENVMNQAPEDANPDGESYIFEFAAANTDVFTDDVVRIEFKIKRFKPEFYVRLWHDNQYLPLDEGEKYFFDGSDYRLSVRADDLGTAFGDLFNGVVTYIKNGDRENPVTTEYNNFVFREPATYTEIIFTLTSKDSRNVDGGSVGLESFTLHKAELKPEKTDYTAVYNGKNRYSELGEVLNVAWGNPEGYPVTMEYSVFRVNPSGGQSSVGTEEVRYPGEYFITFSESNLYTFGGVLKLNITPYSVVADFAAEEKPYAYYGEVYWERGRLYCPGYSYSSGGFTGYTRLILALTDEYLGHFGVTSDYAPENGNAEPFIYTIEGAAPVTAEDQVTGERVNIIEFVVLNGEDAFEVKHAEVSLNYESLKTSYVYGDDIASSIKGSLDTKGVRVPAEDVKIIFDSGVEDSTKLNAGEHTALITLSEESTKNYIWTGGCTFTFTIEKKKLYYFVDEKKVQATDPLPEYASDDLYIYTSEYTSDDLSAINIPVGVTASFILPEGIEGEGVLNEGTYTVTVVFSGESADNYLFIARNGSGKLTVELNTLPQNIALSETEYTYTGDPIALKWENLPERARVGNVPTDAGEYRGIVLYIECPGYASEERKFDFSVAPAVPEVNIENLELEFESGRRLSDGEIRGSAYITGADGERKAVSGSFSLVGSDPTLKYGSVNAFTASFTPDDIENIESVSGVTFHVNAYISEEKKREYFSVTVLKGDGETAESVTASGEYSGISFTVIVSRAVAADTSVTFQGNALKLTDSVVSGVKLITVAILPGLSGELAFWVQGQKVYGLELTFILSVDDTPDEPEAPDDPEVSGEGELQPGGNTQGGSSGNANGGGSSGNGGGQAPGQAVNVSLSDEGKKTLVIVGSSVGGAVVLAGVIILVVVLTKKKKK